METLQRMANRGSISTGYDIDNSCKFENDNSEGLLRNADGDADDRTKFSFSGWYKRTEITRENWMFASGYSSLKFMDDDTLRLELYDGSATSYWDTTRKFRDCSAWYNIVFAVDTTQGTAANRVKVWVNGVFVTNTNTGTAVAQNATTQFGTDADNYQIGYYYAGGVNWRGHCGYMADLHYVDGVVNDADDFGEFDDDTGIWKPKKYAGSYGSNGFNLKFEDSADMGADSSGNSNTYSLTNIAAADQATDTPTNNFAIANVLVSQGGFFVTTEGATKGVLSTSGPGNATAGVSLISTLLASGGKWYFEAQNTNSGDVYLYLGAGDIGDIENWGIDGQKLGEAGVSLAWRGGGELDGKVYINNSATGSADTWETEVVGMALDLDNGVAYFHKAGTWINSGDPAAGTDNGGQYDLPTGGDGQWCIGVSGYNLATWVINFGGYTTMSISSAAADANGYGTFEYAPPSGYYALCTKNLAEFGG